MSLYTIAILSVLFCMLYAWIRRRYNYWEAKGVKSPAPLLFSRNWKNMLSFKESITFLPQRLYNQYPNEKVVGYYQGLKPSLVVTDPEVIKQILMKDFNIFQDRGLMKTHEEFEENLFMIDGERWRMLRQKLTPIFTPGKLKNMVPLVENCALEFSKYVENLIKYEEDQDVRDLSEKYNLTVISSCTFGVDIDCFNDKPNAFKEITNELLRPTLLYKLMKLVNFVLPGFQELMKTLNIIDINFKARNFFLSLINQINQERKSKPKTRHDSVNLMIELKEEGLRKRREDGKSETIDLSPDLIAAQAFVFLIGYDTSSLIMSYLLRELAINQDIQDRVYKEICEIEAKHNSTVTYDSINEMSYLEMCIDETLRKYPVSSVLIRQPSADYVIPGMNLEIEKGTSIMIPLLAMQNDPQYYPNPEVFDPDRFTPENKAARRACTYMPFGEGPRQCIGIRLAKLQLVTGLVYLLKNFQIEKSEKTEENLTFDTKEIQLTPLNGNWVKISKR